MLSFEQINRNLSCLIFGLSLFITFIGAISAGYIYFKHIRWGINGVYAAIFYSVLGFCLSWFLPFVFYLVQDSDFYDNSGLSGFLMRLARILLAIYVLVLFSKWYDVLTRD